eukprot:12885166-Prorocentrum_lima.AAC.1
MIVPKEQLTNNPVVVKLTTAPRPPSPPDESTPFDADDEQMPEKEYQAPATPFRPTTRARSLRGSRCHHRRIRRG